MKNITITNLTAEQQEWLERKAKQKSLTITGYVKHMIEIGIIRDKQIDPDTEYTAGDGCWG